MTEQIAALKEKFLAGNEDFPREEVQELIRTGERLAARAVLTLAAETIGEKNKKHRVLRNKILSLIPDASGVTDMYFAETPNRLTVCLSVGPADYKKIPIMIHEKYVPELQERYEFCSKNAIIFWRHFCELHCAETHLPVHMHELKVDPNNPISLYFEASHPRRVIICGMYRDPEGHILIKQPEAIDQQAQTNAQSDP